jgi:regulatory protein
VNRQRSLLDRAVDLLSRREYSRRELASKLRPHAESPEELEAVLDSLAERAWQSDARFAEQFTRVKGEKYGSLRLRHAMREKGLDSELIEQALAGRDDLTRARDIWQRRFGTPPSCAQERARQVRFLAARGFSLDIIRRVVSGVSDDLSE